MKVLIVWRGIPVNWDVSTNKILRVLQYLYNTGNEVTLVTFKSRSTSEDQISQIQKYSKLFLIDYPSRFQTCVSHLRYFNISLFPLSLKMKEVIKRVLVDEKIDIIYVDQGMLNHVLKLDTEVPRVLDIVDPINYSSFQHFKNDKNMKRKSWFLVRYICYRYFDLPRYKNFDAFIFVSSIHRKLLAPYIPKNKIQFCIPQGVDTEWFMPQNNEASSNCLIFTGSMSYAPNIYASVFFCNKIFPLIKKETPDVIFYIVGSNPHEEVLKLESEDVVVTGFVEDMRLYFTKSSVVVVPIVTDDGGFKVKVLEAMAMGKATVSTSLGTKGLTVTDGENIIIKDDPEEFAGAVINLLKNERLKLDIGKKARDLVIDQYSYKVMESSLLKAFENVLQDRD